MTRRDATWPVVNQSGTVNDLHFLAAIWISAYARAFQAALIDLHRAQIRLCCAAPAGATRNWRAVLFGAECRFDSRRQMRFLAAYFATAPCGEVSGEEASC